MNPETPIKPAKVDAEEVDMLRDFESALRTIRSARGVFFLLLVLSLLVHIAAFAAVRWGHVLEAKQALETQIASADPPPASESSEETEDVGDPAFIAGVIQFALPFTEFVGQVSCALLAVCFLVSTQVCLAGGLGGVRGSLSAFFWMLVLLALLFPWSRWMSGMQVPGVYLVYAELEQFPQSFSARLPEVLAYVRFLGYPILALLIVFVANGRYARGYRLVRRHLESRLHVRPI
jgi:hypothetical protein